MIHLPIRFTLVILSFLCHSALFSQVKFEKVYGGAATDHGYSVVQTFDKGYVVAGTTTSFGSGNTDAYILKTDSMGVPLWHKSFGGLNIDQTFSIKETADTGLIIAGYTNSFGYGGYDMYIIKTNRYGDTLWTKMFGGTNWDFAYSIAQTTDGGYIIAGGTYSYGSGNEDFYLVKTNSSGVALWTKTYGGTNDDEAKSVKQTSDGGYILTGSTKSFGDSDGDIYTIKTDSNGDTLWTYLYQALEEDFSSDVLESYTGKYIIGGTTKSAIDGFERIKIELSSLGTLVNTTNYSGPEDDGINSIVESSGGKFAFSGYTYSYGFGPFTSDYFLVIENQFSGTVGFTYGGTKNETPYSLATTSDGGYIICGISNSYTAQDHIFLVKTDSNGLAPSIPGVIATNINSLAAAKKQFVVSPNPAEDDIIIRIEDTGINKTTPFIVAITDVLGKSTFHSFDDYNFSDAIKINTMDLPNGMYFISLSNDHFIQTQKIVIDHQ